MKCTVVVQDRTEERLAVAALTSRQQWECDQTSPDTPPHSDQVGNSASGEGGLFICFATNPTNLELWSVEARCRWKEVTEICQEPVKCQPAQSTWRFIQVPRQLKAWQTSFNLCCLVYTWLEFISSCFCRTSVKLCVCGQLEHELAGLPGHGGAVRQPGLAAVRASGAAQVCGQPGQPGGLGGERQAGQHQGGHRQPPGCRAQEGTQSEVAQCRAGKGQTRIIFGTAAIQPIPQA